MLEDNGWGEGELSRYRYGERELRAFTDDAIDPQVAAVGFDDMFRDGKAQAGTAGFAGTGSVHAIEALEDAFFIGGRNADAGVGHGDDGFFAAQVGADA